MIHTQIFFSLQRYIKVSRYAKYFSVRFVQNRRTLQASAYFVCLLGKNEPFRQQFPDQWREYSTTPIRPKRLMVQCLVFDLLCGRMRAKAWFANRVMYKFVNPFQCRTIFLFVFQFCYILMIVILAYSKCKIKR